jgi:hypothetical protein
MIYAAKSLCQITENSSNMHFFRLVDFSRLSVSLMASFSVDIAFLIVVSMQVVP